MRGEPPSERDVLVVGEAITAAAGRASGTRELGEAIAGIVGHRLGLAWVQLEFLTCGNGQTEVCTYEDAARVHDRSEELADTLQLPAELGVSGLLRVVPGRRGLSWPCWATDYLAGHIAVLLRASSLAGEDRAEIETLRALLGITCDISTHLDIDAAIDAIMTAAAQALHVPAADILTFDRGADSWTITHVHNIADIFIDAPLPLPDAFHEAMRAGKPFILDGYGEWAVAHPGPLPQRVLAEWTEWERWVYLIAPLRDLGEIVGAIVVLDEKDNRVFSERDMESLALYASAASIVLSNARVHSATVRTSVELEHRVEERTRQLDEALQALSQKTDQLQRILDATIRRPVRLAMS